MVKTIKKINRQTTPKKTQFNMRLSETLKAELKYLSEHTEMPIAVILRNLVKREYRRIRNKYPLEEKRI